MNEDARGRHNYALPLYFSRNGVVVFLGVDDYSRLSTPYIQQIFQPQTISRYNNIKTWLGGILRLGALSASIISKHRYDCFAQAIHPSHNHHHVNGSIQWLNGSVNGSITHSP